MFAFTRLLHVPATGVEVGWNPFSSFVVRCSISAVAKEEFSPDDWPLQVQAHSHPSGKGDSGNLLAGPVAVHKAGHPGMVKHLAVRGVLASETAVEFPTAPPGPVLFSGRLLMGTAALLPHLCPKERRRDTQNAQCTCHRVKFKRVLF